MNKHKKTHKQMDKLKLKRKYRNKVKGSESTIFFSLC